MSTPTQSSPKRSKRTARLLLILFAALIAVAVAGFLTYEVFGGSIETMQGTPDYVNILLVNLMVGVCVFLFITELKLDAVRVVTTVIVALILGYLVTFSFNLDTANRYIQGEAKAWLISDAEPVENDAVDLEYNRQRAATFNQVGTRSPITEAAFTFEGHRGDTITAIAYAANRRVEADLQVALLSPDGVVLAEGFSMTPEQVEAYDDVRRETDAIIEDFTLPTDGVYTIQMQPEPLGTGLVLNEAVQQTNLAYQAFLMGPISRPNRWAVWIQDAITLGLVGLAVSIVFRAQQFSLGAEGQLYFGALASGAMMLAVGNFLPTVILIPLAVISAMLAGFLWGIIPGALKAYLGANELVSTLMLNTLALRFYELILIFQLKPDDVGYIASDWFPEAGTLPVILEGTQVTTAVYIMAIVIVLAWLLMRRTPLGYEIRIIGSNLNFADYGGIKTRRNIMLVMAISGAVAGLAGMHLGMGIHRRLILNISLGLAFEGVVVALLARNNVLVAPFTALLYAYLRAGAQFMERDANVSFEVVRIIQAVIILLITAEALTRFFRSRQISRQQAVQNNASGGSTQESALPDPT
jgi:general nucleoside transport system permease protein